jgi:hypothetical protein
MGKAVRDETAKIRNFADGEEHADGSGLHVALVRAVTHLCRNAAEGCTGLNAALSVLEREFIAARQERNVLRRDRRNPFTEWLAAVHGAIAEAAARKQERTDTCRVLSGMRPRRTR